MLETSRNKRQIRQASILQATITRNKGKDPKKSRYSMRACILCILCRFKAESSQLGIDTPLITLTKYHIADSHLLASIWHSTKWFPQTSHHNNWRIESTSNLRKENHTNMSIVLDSMGGGAWPFLLGGVICLVNSDNERDLNLLNSQEAIL